MPHHVLISESRMPISLGRYVKIGTKVATAVTCEVDTDSGKTFYERADTSHLEGRSGETLQLQRPSTRNSIYI